MKIDNRILFLLVPPVIAIILCSLSSFVLPKNSSFVPEQPEFLTYVDKLSVFTVKGEQEKPSSNIKDVFRHEWAGLLPGQNELPALPALRNTGGIKPLPISATMIVEGGHDSYCIINDRKMHLGDKTDSFKVTSIQRDQVTITFKNGTREIHHVKVY